ncbi:hypothetical protein JCM5296_003436 [Sporobolomyces johnsonii]
MIPVKRRVTRACDFCHRRGLKCTQRDDADPPTCESCVRHGVDCTYDRPAKKRGPAARSKASDSPTPVAGPSRSPALPIPPPHPSVAALSHAAVPGNSLWRPSVLVPVFALLKVLQTYYEAVYPIFPYFVWPHFIGKVSTEEHLNNRPFYGTVMAASALALARIRDNAALTNPLSPKEASALPSPEALFAAAEDALPKDLTEATDFDYLRTTALLAITSIQFANPRKMHQHLGAFWTLCAMNRVHDEKRWPQVGRIEAEERRRVYWSMYTLDIFTSISYGGVLRTREATSLVDFPSEIDDDYIVDEGNSVQPSSVLSWLIGWNFTSQLYKTLEHALDSGPGHDSHTNSPRITGTSVLDLLDTAYSSLPQAFKETQPYSNVPQQDRFGYQTANIIVTLHTVRMVAVCRNLCDSAQRDQAVQIAETLLREIGAIPLAYLQAISSPLINHLVGIYKLLFPITERRLTPDLFVRIRQLLIDMTTLLGRLESRLTYSIDVAERFKSQISRMDDAQAIGASAPPSPRLQTTHPLPQTTGEGQPPGASFGLNLPAAIPPPWEAAFELQDVFQDWPFDFSHAALDVPNGLPPAPPFDLGAATGEITGGAGAAGEAAGAGPSASAPNPGLSQLWW